MIFSNGLNVGGEIAAVFDARVERMRGEGRTRTARMLPDATALIPMETQTAKGAGNGAVAGGWKCQPNPFADDFGEFILVRQSRPQEIQDLLCGQFSVVIVSDLFG